MGYRNTNTDYLDDVSGNYVNKGTTQTVSKALADRSGEKTGVYIGTRRKHKEVMVTATMTLIISLRRLTLSYILLLRKSVTSNKD